MSPNDNEIVVLRIQVVITLGGRSPVDKMEEFHIDHVTISV